MKLLKLFSLLNILLSGKLPHKFQPPLPPQTPVCYLIPARRSCLPVFSFSGFLSCAACCLVSEKSSVFPSSRLLHHDVEVLNCFKILGYTQSYPVEFFQFHTLFREPSLALIIHIYCPILLHSLSSFLFFQY